MGPEGVRTSSEKINVKVSSGGEIYNDLGLWDQVLNGMIEIIIIIDYNNYYKLIQVGVMCLSMVGLFCWV